jgi:hypothetical protein
MRKVLLLLFYCLLFSADSSYAQKISFADTSNVWKLSGFNASYGTTVSESKYGRDTFLNGHNYKQLGGYYCRYDTLENKVYALIPADTPERVIYNYNLKLGDTFTYKYYATLYTHEVTALDSFIANGVYHKKWLMHYIGPPPTSGISYKDYTVIEGIGCDEEPMFPINPFFWIKKTNYTLICFTNRGNIITVPKSTTGYFVSPTTCGISTGIFTGNMAKEYESVVIAPNPANENSRIVFPYAIQQGSLVVINTTGQVVLQKDFQSKEQIVLGALPAEGLYYYRVTDIQNGTTFTGKLVYE